MKTKIILTLVILLTSINSFAQNSWTICNSPAFASRVDDIFMVNTQIGYAVCGDGQILKTIDGGNNWIQLIKDSLIYCRSVEFIDTQKGFVGGFSSSGTTNILRKTIDGGATWIDLSSMLNPKARKGICGLAVADTNTIYGCGNWFQDSAYVVKSSDGGNTWNFIDMTAYASSLIDMYFTSKDTGFATGRGPLPLQTAVILYTTNGGLTWTYKFQNTTPNEYCWKIQHLTNLIYYASIEDLTIVPPNILKSIDGGMTWTLIPVIPTYYNVEGVGFLNPLQGWTGGGSATSFETNDGGITWDSINICPIMNRVFKVNDSLLFATGDKIWRYAPIGTGIKPSFDQVDKYAAVNCYPNPVNETLAIAISLSKSTHSLIILFDEHGREIKLIENADKQKGDYKYNLNTTNLSAGIYYIVLKTHEDKVVKKIVVNH